MRQHFLHPVQRRFHVRRDHLVDVAVGELRGHARDAAAGVVDPDVDAPEPLDRRIDEASLPPELRPVAARLNGMLERLERDFASVGVEVRYFPYTVTTSSTILRRALAALENGTQPERARVGR